MEISGTPNPFAVYTQQTPRISVEETTTRFSDADTVELSTDATNSQPLSSDSSGFPGDPIDPSDPPDGGGSGGSGGG